MCSSETSPPPPDTPTPHTPGVNPQRFVDGFQWDEFKWRRGELAAQFEGKTVMVGVGALKEEG